MTRLTFKKFFICRLFNLLISLAQQDRHDKTLVVPYKDNEQVADD